MDDRGRLAGGWRLHGPLMYRRTDAPTYRRTDVPTHRRAGPPNSPGTDAGSGDPAYKSTDTDVVGRVPSRGGTCGVV